jgi:Ni/Fe-hydrogenase subunit HybB-like protein
MNRVHNVKLVLWLITGLAAAVGISRFVFGLGVTTHLSDATPWGLWIGFDVMAGVALAAGGFVMTAIFYIMKREEFKPLVRPAVLTAFLGYIAVIVGLIFDLGLPWNIWHMIIYWNPHSPLFEVGWCVMLYTAVLLLEFSPIPLEETSRYARIRAVLMKFRFPLVFLGIMLSTLHQSSLGSLFLIMPFKLYPLWYSPILPIEFFISAVALGLMMVSFESLFSHWLYKRPAASDRVAKLAKAAMWVLILYFVVKMTDLAVAGKLSLIVNGSWESVLFIMEIMISVLIPVVLFAVPRLRASAAGQWAGSILVVTGIVFNRLNVGGLTMLRATGGTYVPSWTEITISLGVVSMAALVFLFAVEKFHIWERPPRDPETDPYAMPEFDVASQTWLGEPMVAARTKYSLVFILSFALGFAFMPGARVHSQGIEHVPAQKARGGDTLFIDGNFDGYGVEFDHARHVDSVVTKDSCALCHHMNMPLDKNSGCWQCHREMYTTTDVFRHDWHADPAGANISCSKCHPEGQRKQAATAAKCDDCHIDLFPAGAGIKVENYQGASYVDAMHELCVTCHTKKAAELADKKNLAQCASCHEGEPPQYLKGDMQSELAVRKFNRVVIPEQYLKKDSM